MIEISVSAWVYWMYICLAGIGAAKVADWIFTPIYNKVANCTKDDEVKE